jgi:hypothetical protein
MLVFLSTYDSRGDVDGATVAATLLLDALSSELIA